MTYKNMTYKNILQTIEKKYANEPSQAEWILSQINNLPKNKWFSPSNTKELGTFTICDDLYEYGLISKMIEPIWLNGSYMGNRVSFMIKVDNVYPDLDGYAEIERM